MKKKKTYLAPLTTVTSVELESPICGGSADITNPNEDYGRINEQAYSKDFGNNGEADFGSSWEAPANN